TIDVLDDQKLEKSRTFEITGEMQRIEMMLTDGFWHRAIEFGSYVAPQTRQVTVHRIEIHVVAWPRYLTTDKLLTLRDVEINGGRVIGMGAIIPGVRGAPDE